MREIGVLLVALYLSAVVASIVLAVVAQRRFIQAYIDRYGDRRHGWQFFWRLPDGSSWLWGRFWYRMLDDPSVERRRREVLLTWLTVFLLVATPLMFVFFEEYGAIEFGLWVVFLISSLVGGTYWWTSVHSERNQLPRWGVWIYVGSGLIGLAAFALWVAVHYGPF